MALPKTNPITAGWINEGAAVDHLGSNMVDCPVCRQNRNGELFRLILGRSPGFCVHFSNPKHTSTRGKLGTRTNWSMCCTCDSMWPSDPISREAVASFALRNRLPDDFGVSDWKSGLGLSVDT